MVHSIYIDTNRRFEDKLIHSGKDAGSGLPDGFPLLSLREIVEINGDISQKTLTKLKEYLSVDYTESVAGRKNTAGKTFTVMAKDGVPNERVKEIKRIIQLLEPEAVFSVRTGKEYTFPFGCEDSAELSERLVNPFTETVSSEPENTLPDDDESLVPIKGFMEDDYGALTELKKKLDLEMDIDDIMCVQNYFLSESRNPTLLELKMIDRFFSEHFRHSTFEIILDDVLCDDATIKDTWNEFRALTGKNTSLSAIAKKFGVRSDDDDIVSVTDKLYGVRIHSDGEGKPVLIAKNEAHARTLNITSYDNASNCLVGSVRDLFCGLGYSFDSYRICGKNVSDETNGLCFDRKHISEYTENVSKLGIPCSGYREIKSDVFSGRQFDLATVLAVSDEKKFSVLKDKIPVPGDVFCIIGAKTGRDGKVCFQNIPDRADKTYKRGSYLPMAQPGILASLQRMFTEPGFENIPIAINDIGSGGIICALGEMSYSITVFADLIPLKYEGVTLTERLISETEERMVVCVSSDNLPALYAYASAQNLDCTLVATVNSEERFIIANSGITPGTDLKTVDPESYKNYDTLISVSSEFLEEGGVEKHFSAKIENPVPFDASPELLVSVPDDKKLKPLKRLFKASKMNFTFAAEKILETPFEPDENPYDQMTSGTVVYPYSEKRPEAGVREIRYRSEGFTESGEPLCAAVSCGILPELCEKDPYRAAYLTVTEALMKLYVSGFGDRKKYTVMHEYFQRHENNSKRLGIPVAMMLGAYKAISDFGIHSLGGRCTMARNKETGASDNPGKCALSTFAFCTGKASSVITSTFTKAGNNVLLLRPQTDEKLGLPDVTSQKRVFEFIKTLSESNKIVSASSVNAVSPARAVARICGASGKGFVFRRECTAYDLFDNCFGGALIEIEGDCPELPENSVLLGAVSEEMSLGYENESVPLFKDKPETAGPEPRDDGVQMPKKEFLYLKNAKDDYGTVKTVKPGVLKVLIPLTEFTVASFETAKLFEAEGAETEILPLSHQSVSKFKEALKSADILYIPDSSGHNSYLTAILRTPEISRQITELRKRGGLIYGTGSGFEVLLESGLLELNKKLIGFAGNPINEYEIFSTGIKTVSVLSPFMRKAVAGNVYDTFVTGKHLCLCGDPEYVSSLAHAGRIGAQFKDERLGTVYSVESVSSPDGHVFGQISVPERIRSGLISGDLSPLPVITSACGYFKR